MELGLVVVEAGQQQIGVHIGDPDELGQHPAAEDGGPSAGAHGEHGGGAPPGEEAVGHLTAPAVRPERQNRCRPRKASRSGTTATSEPVITRG